ncbi:hypothetical protein [Streptomyces sp. IBSBF 3136]|uniref:hypothetical protein n=1 Tax=Streptomyces sp. IBSBF 3136 TaxID=2903524 RepID=UPI002FDBC88D
MDTPYTKSRTSGLLGCLSFHAWLRQLAVEPLDPTGTALDVSAGLRRPQPGLLGKAKQGREFLGLDEQGCAGYGCEADEVGGGTQEEVPLWDRAHRGDRACIGVYPAGTPDEQVVGARVIDRPHARITISWP